MNLEWTISKPFYGMEIELLLAELNRLSAAGWTIKQILEPTLHIVAYRQRSKK